MGGQRRQVAHPTSPATSYSPVHPRTPHNPHPLAGHQPFPALQRTAPGAPPNTYPGVEAPASTQQRTTPATTHTRVRHGWPRGRHTRSKGLEERVGGLCCARQRKDRAREFGGERLLCAPVGETTPQVAIPGPTSRRWGEVPHRRLGMAAWTHVANGEGICLRRRQVKQCKFGAVMDLIRAPLRGWG